MSLIDDIAGYAACIEDGKHRYAQWDSDIQFCRVCFDMHFPQPHFTREMWLRRVRRQLRSGCGQGGHTWRTSDSDRALEPWVAMVCERCDRKIRTGRAELEALLEQVAHSAADQDDAERACAAHLHDHGCSLTSCAAGKALLAAERAADAGRRHSLRSAWRMHQTVSGQNEGPALKPRHGTADDAESGAALSQSSWAPQWSRLSLASRASVTPSQ